MSHPECNLKIEYKKTAETRNLWQRICRGEQRSPVDETSPRLQPLQDRTKNYPITLVGAWRNFCSQAHRNATARSKERVLYFFHKPCRGIKAVEGSGRRISAKQKLRRSPTMLNLQQILNTGDLWSPLQVFGQVLPPQNRSALCGLYVVQEDSKAVQI